jgi:hypothetical protein
MDMTPNQDVLHDVGVVEKLDVLERSRNTQAGHLIGSYPGDVTPFKMDAARGRVIDAADQIKNGGFPGAVGSDDGENTALFNLKRDTIDRLNATEMNGKIFDLKEAHSVGLNA